MRWKWILLLIICAALSFGGSFTCHTSSGSISTTRN
jgi:hypothetical protein